MVILLRNQAKPIKINNFADGYDWVFQDITQIIQSTKSVQWTNIEILAKDFVYESWWAVVRTANQRENTNP